MTRKEGRFLRTVRCSKSCNHCGNEWIRATVYCPDCGREWHPKTNWGFIGELALAAASVFLLIWFTLYSG
jgi:hypothetical protein